MKILPELLSNNNDQKVEETQSYHDGISKTEESQSYHDGISKKEESQSYHDVISKTEDQFQRQRLKWC